MAIPDSSFDTISVSSMQSSDSIKHGGTERLRAKAVVQASAVWAAVERALGEVVFELNTLRLLIVPEAGELRRDHMLGLARGEGCSQSPSSLHYL